MSTIPLGTNKYGMHGNQSTEPGNIRKYMVPAALDADASLITSTPSHYAMEPNQAINS